MMYERMLDKTVEPTLDQIEEYLGQDEYMKLIQFEKELNKRYDLKKELRFPFGNTYGWGYKYSHKAFHLCYVFFEKNAFTVMIQVGDKQVSTLESMKDILSSHAWNLWLERYPCGDNGGWVHLRVLDKSNLEDALLYVSAKKKVVKKI